MDEEIYKMKLHEVLEPRNTNYQIVRVPGGWIYRFVTENYTPVGQFTFDTVFVPFSNEFHVVPKVSADDDPWEPTEDKTND